MSSTMFRTLSCVGPQNVARKKKVPPHLSVVLCVRALKRLMACVIRRTKSWCSFVISVEV
jgi:hypothetical protein